MKSDWYPTAEPVNVIELQRELKAAKAERDALLDRLQELADNWQKQADHARAQTPQQGRWTGRAVAYGTCASDLHFAMLPLRGKP